MVPVAEDKENDTVPPMPPEGAEQPPLPEIPGEMPQPQAVKPVAMPPSGPEGGRKGPALLWALVAATALGLVMVLVWLSSRPRPVSVPATESETASGLQAPTTPAPQEAIRREPSASGETERKPRLSLSPESWEGRVTLPPAVASVEGEPAPPPAKGAASVDLSWEAWNQAMADLAGPVGTGGNRMVGEIRLEDTAPARGRVAQRRLTIPGLTVLQVAEGKPMVARPVVPFPESEWWQERGWSVDMREEDGSLICRIMRRDMGEKPEDRLAIGSRTIAGFALDEPGSSYRRLPEGWSLVERSGQVRGMVFDTCKVADSRGNLLGYLYGRGERLVAVEGLSPLLHLGGVVRVGDPLRQVLGLGRSLEVEPLGRNALMVRMEGSEVRMLLAWDEGWRNPETVRNLTIQSFFLGWPPTWEEQ